MPDAERKVYFRSYFGTLPMAFFTRLLVTVIDWEAIAYRRIEKYLPHICNDYGMSEMISEMLGN